MSTLKKCKSICIFVDILTRKLYNFVEKGCEDMAETIVKPKRFTTEWFRYIWDYYKMHILVFLAVVVLGVITVVDIVNTVKYDLNINYVATNVFPIQSEPQLTETACEQIEDINSDGEQNVSFSQLNFTDEVLQDGNQVMTLENKRMILFASEDEMLYIFDEFMLKNSLDMSAAEGIFVPVQQWVNPKNANVSFYEYKDGMYAASLADSKLLTKLGVDSSDMYVVVRMNYFPENIELEKRYENCVTFANMLLE